MALSLGLGANEHQCAAAGREADLRELMLIGRGRAFDRVGDAEAAQPAARLRFRAPDLEVGIS